MGTWVELVMQTLGVTFHGRALSLVEPFELTDPVTVGGAGCSIAVDGESALPFTLRPLSGGELEVVQNGRRRRCRMGQLVSLSSGNAGVALNFVRVIGSSALGTCGLPGEVPAPVGPLDDTALRVFGDQLLEQGYSIGERFHLRAADDLVWLGPFTPTDVATWRGGVVERLRLTQFRHPWALCQAMRKTGIVRLMRHLELSGRRTEITQFVEALTAQGGLPWLESVGVVVRPEFPPTVAERRAAMLELKQLRNALEALVGQLPTLQRPPSLSEGAGWAALELG